MRAALILFQLKRWLNKELKYYAIGSLDYKLIKQVIDKIKELEKKKMRKLLKLIRVGDLVKINSNCSNTRKPVYKVYGVLKTERGTFYLLSNENGLHKHYFKKEEVVLL